MICDSGVQCVNPAHLGLKPHTAEERFWSYVERGPENQCWEWQGYIDIDGYGQFWNETLCRAHRYAYELMVGPIPEGLVLDHLCNNKICVNPHHLEATTNRTNTLRADGLPSRNARKTHCLHGHPFNEVNTYRGEDGGRRCRTCLRMYRARVSQTRREERTAILAGLSAKCSV